MNSSIFGSFFHISFREEQKKKRNDYFNYSSSNTSALRNRKQSFLSRMVTEFNPTVLYEYKTPGFKECINPSLFCFPEKKCYPSKVFRPKFFIYIHIYF